VQIHVRAPFSSVFALSRRTSPIRLAERFRDGISHRRLGAGLAKSEIPGAEGLISGFSEEFLEQCGFFSRMD
jgi:hypothetical protein